jgi:hypothetical protein
VSARNDLPIPDYDHLPVGSLAHRIRALDDAGLQRVLDYERSHADRVAVVELLTRRLDDVRSGAAEPSSGDPAGAQPEHAPPADAGSPGNEAATPVNNQPLRHGVSEQTPNRDIRAR